MIRRPEIIAHRGANREAPENTIPAFERALAFGVAGIELDVHVTRDNVPVVHHDAVLPDGGRIERLDSADLERRTDAPTLAQVLELVSGRCHVYVEIKAATTTTLYLVLYSPRGEPGSYAFRVYRYAP